MPSKNDHDELEPVFAKLASELERPLLKALRNAYVAACEQYAEYDGANGSTFGTNVYHFSNHELVLAAKTDPLLKITSHQPPFRFTAGAYEFCCHRVGRSETDDIWTHFPNAKGATAMVSRQLPLFADAGPDLKSVRRLVVAHMGNHEDGVCAVYLCIGKTADEEHIKEWAYTYCLWQRDGSAVATEPTSNLPQNLTPEETVEEKEPRRKVRRSDAEGEG